MAKSKSMKQKLGASRGVAGIKSKGGAKSATLEYRGYTQGPVRHGAKGLLSSKGRAGK